MPFNFDIANRVAEQVLGEPVTGPGIPAGTLGLFENGPQIVQLQDGGEAMATRTTLMLRDSVVRLAVGRAVTVRGRSWTIAEAPEAVEGQTTYTLERA
ncbi:hypothetical protein [Azospirillum sp. B4]|uniref:head-tail joining protein n=1 Tax=Azospirillum sp. B4 TaxID=95605 RepID=UPI00034B3954|nr:hypothetical protein [Azospirillum sp. B4]